jgi:hypothetical protein
MIKRFLRKLFPEPIGKQSVWVISRPKKHQIEDKRPSNPIEELKRKVGATERMDESVETLKIEEGIRSALDRPDIPLTAERLSLINKAMACRAKVLDRISESSRKRLIDALAKHLAQGKK